MFNSSFARQALGAAAFAAFASLTWPAAAQYNENGVGPDPDGDSNPATMTSAIANLGATDIKLDPHFTVMTFEPPPGAHGRVIGGQYAGTPYEVTFSKGLEWQICDGPRYYEYDSLCTYLRPPSGSFAAYYRDDWKRPLTVTFKEPVCAMTLSVYPTGGREGEKFRVSLKAKKADGTSAGKASVKFAWTQDTFRWRVMVGGFFLKENAKSIDVTVRRVGDSSDVVQFLIDDLRYAETGCEQTLEKIRDVAGFEVDDDGNLVTRSAQ